MAEILDMVRQNGDWFYLITFVWAALEGETFVIFAALAAQRGFLNIGALFVAAWLGSFCGDQVFFFLGRRYGTRIIAHYPKLQPKFDKAVGWLEKYAAAFILSYRFMYGIRNVSGIAIGMSRIPWRRFAILNLAAAFIWALAFCGAGYLFGNIFAHLGKHREAEVNYEVRSLMIAALGLFAAVIIARVMFVRWRNRRDQAQVAPPDDVPPAS